MYVPLPVADVVLQLSFHRLGVYELEYGLDELAIQTNSLCLGYVVFEQALPSVELQNRDIVFLLKSAYLLNPFHSLCYILYDSRIHLADLRTQTGYPSFHLLVCYRSISRSEPVQQRSTALTS